MGQHFGHCHVVARWIWHHHTLGSPMCRLRVKTGQAKNGFSWELLHPGTNMLARRAFCESKLMVTCEALHPILYLGILYDLHCELTRVVKHSHCHPLFPVLVEHCAQNQTLNALSCPNVGLYIYIIKYYIYTISKKYRSNCVPEPKNDTMYICIIWYTIYTIYITIYTIYIYIYPEDPSAFSASTQVYSVSGWPWA